MKKTCQALTKNGSPCNAPAIAGSDLCLFHSDPLRARSLGREGGRKNRRTTIDLEIPHNIDASALRNILAQTLRMLVAGDLDSRTALTINHLCNGLQRSLPIAELQDDLVAIKQKLAAIEAAHTAVVVDSEPKLAGDAWDAAKESGHGNTDDNGNALTTSSKMVGSAADVCDGTTMASGGELDVCDRTTIASGGENDHAQSEEDGFDSTRATTEDDDI